MSSREQSILNCDHFGRAGSARGVSSICVDYRGLTPEAVLADILTADDGGGDRAALAEQEIAHELAASVMVQVDRMAEVIREANAGRLASTLDRLAADGDQAKAAGPAGADLEAREPWGLVSTRCPTQDVPHGHHRR